jgi:hypothetical protein
MSNIKISELEQAQIDFNDIIPFVQVPNDNGVLVNKKVVFNDLRAAVLNGINPGTSLFTNTLMIDNNNNSDYTFGIQVNNLVKAGDPPIPESSSFHASFDNPSGLTQNIEFTQDMKILASAEFDSLDDIYNPQLVAICNIYTWLTLDGGAPLLISRKKLNYNFIRTTTGIVINSIEENFISVVNFVLETGHQAIIENSTDVTFLDYPSGNSIPVAAHDLFTLRVSNNQIDTNLNTKIFS